jgi:hypothetical protein
MFVERRSRGKSSGLGSGTATLIAGVAEKGDECEELDSIQRKLRKNKQFEEFDWRVATQDKQFEEVGYRITTEDKQFESLEPRFATESSKLEEVSCRIATEGTKLEEAGCRITTEDK